MTPSPAPAPAPAPGVVGVGPGYALWLVVAWLVFFGWNLWFCALAWFGFGPLVFVPLGVATASGMIPWHVGVFGFLGLALPAAFLVLGAWRLWHDAGRLLSLFYGVEAPLLVLVLLRLFAIGELTPATLLMLGSGGFAALGLLRTLLGGPAEATAARQVARQISATVGLVLGLAGMAVVAIYAVPIPPLVLEGLSQLRPGDFSAPPTVLATAFVGFGLMTIGLVAVWPVVAFGLSLRQQQLVTRATTERLGGRATTGITLGTASALLGGFAVASVQPQGRAFARLDAVATDADRRALLADGDRIRDGLVAAALHEGRYLDGDPDGRHVIDLWTEAGLGPFASAAQATWKVLLHPVRYHPVPRPWDQTGDDEADAKQRYADTFDVPMEIAERDAFLAAAAATWDAEEAHAGLLDAGDGKVRLAEQAITVTPSGDLAVVRIADQYRNLTWNPEEVAISFSLPETAVITDLRLSTGPDFDRADRRVIAPRGAAQQVYERSVQRRVDPALLEEVGPGAYRLRAFPVPARTGSSRDPFSIVGEGEPLYLWLEYAVPVDVTEAPCWPMPRVAETRNLAVDPDSRTLDGAPISVDGWAPACVPAPGAGRRAHRAVVGDELVTMSPAGPLAARSLGHVAVFVDGTASMAAHRSAVDDALTELRAASEQLDVWCVVEDRPARCDGYEAADALFYGAVPLEARMRALAVGEVDHLVLLTDGVVNPHVAAPRLAPPLAAPTWLVHLGGLPSVWPDELLDPVRRSGGAALASVGELVLRVSAPEVRDGWRVAVVPAAGADGGEDGPFRKVAARRVVAEAETRATRGTLVELDGLHAIAKEHGIVTPYSSMLVLVTDAQREELARAEQEGDRFQREATDLPPPPDLSSVPEPGTWALGGLALAAAAVAQRRRKSASQVGGPRI